MRPIAGPTDCDGAPVSAPSCEQSFWDYLGATRAEEYATEDILDLCPEPVRFQETLTASKGDGPAAQEVSDHVEDMPPDRDMAVPHAQQSGRIGVRTDPAVRWDNIRPLPPQTIRRTVSSAQTRRARWSYRLQRIWLTPVYRALITKGLPTVAFLGMLVVALADAQNRAQLARWSEAAYAAVVDRPEFMVSSVTVSSVAPELDRSIRARLATELPRSSFRLDLAALRDEIEAYDSVAEAALRLGADGALVVTVQERAPVVLWHSGRARELLDIDGHRVAKLSEDAEPPDLPLIAGDGAKPHVREALALLDAAQPLGARLRGLVRVGARRWDVVLDRDQRIRLPERGAMQALERVLALDDAQDLLARDVLSVDMRNPSRPILHVSPGALETLRAIRVNPSEASQ